MEFIVETFLFVTVIGLLFYKFATKNYKYFSQRNIAHEKPVILIGNALPILSGKESLIEMLIRLHTEFKNEKIYGLYGWRDPYTFIRDPELIKKITIKDFDSFVNHDNNTAQTQFTDEAIANMLTLLQDQKWKDMRMTLTPVFTGNKMRKIFHIISQCTYEAVKYLHEKTKEGTEINLGNFFHQYSNDVIASAAFGLKMKSYGREESEFTKMGAVLLRPEGLGVIIKSILIAVLPQVGKIFKINILSTKALNYLKGVVSQTIKQRKENKIIRQDMIQLMLESQKHGESKTEEKTDNRETVLTNWTENEMIAQCLLFLFAGLGPMSNLMCVAAYELMKNPDIQEKLYEEVSQMNEELNGSEISYDLLKNMKYLNMVVSESLRKWPSAPFLDRVCNKSYNLTDDDGKILLEMKPGDKVLFSVYGSHFDEENFENPSVFDPERFSDENKKSNIKPFTYFPFGLGPRSCIGDRFGLMVAKLMLYHLVLEFKLSPSPKSTVDINEVTRGLQLKIPEVFWMDLIARNKTPVFG
ncbi:probable cytochrome P450 9f2 [Episyrphus balteatus]|uniref:probable cytochrome P450 9f2 n=1 Tax=Episyrphus balteatus TaxID=286459 RepID=UPI0024861E5A|nr:probable cytochrome P450 9f2 [Episyrphus balteatus]